MENTLVKLSRHGTCIEIATYSRKFGKHGRFSIVADSLLEYYSGNRKHPFYDTDCGNFLQMTFWKGVCTMRITWLSVRWSGKCEGVQETISIPTDVMIDFMCYSEHDVKMLSGEEPKAGTITFTESAMRNIREMDSRTRRAFCKAMAKDRLRWPDTETRVWADGPNDFYFRTNDGMCGGLIRHDYRGKYEYSVHT